MSANDLAAALWLAAKRDRIAAEVLAESDRAPLENLCFLAQQVLEKLFKCALALHGASFPRTHDLITLADLLDDAGIAVPVSAAELDKLMPCAVLARYEGLAPGDLQRDDLIAILVSAHRWADHLQITHALP